uniref:Uncharacterized protein n=1 Tax=Rhizophora mucronata TaxID=61149 RepID=A0A2P2P7L9_RHIMU
MTVATNPSKKFRVVGFLSSIISCEIEASYIKSQCHQRMASTLIHQRNSKLS